MASIHKISKKWEQDGCKIVPKSAFWGSGGTPGDHMGSRGAGKLILTQFGEDFGKLLGTFWRRFSHRSAHCGGYFGGIFFVWFPGVVFGGVV